MRSLAVITVVMSMMLGITGLNHFAAAQCGTWRPVGPGVYSGVRAFTTYHGQLIAGGGDVDGGGANDISWMASWNGSTWQYFFGCGYDDNGFVEAAVEYNGELFAAGTFYCAGGVEVHNIARWNGAIWQPLGSGIDGVYPYYLFCLAVYNGDLVAAGRFTVAGGVPANNIARWNSVSEQWQPLGSGIEVAGQYSAIYSLIVYKGELIAAGEITSAGGQNANCIARWNGSEWRTLGSGLQVSKYPHDPPSASSFTIYNGELIVSGNFKKAGGHNANGIARWNGAIWKPLGDENDGSVGRMVVYHGELCAVGHLAGATEGSINRWDGDTWKPIGGGMPCYGCYNADQSTGVYSLTVYNDQLFAGGGFNGADGQTAYSIARWRECSDESSELPRFSNPLSISNSYDPFVPGAMKIFFGQEGGRPAHLVVSYLDQTRDFQVSKGRAVPCRIREETELVDGRLYRFTRGFFAQADDGSIYQFGQINESYQHSYLDNPVHSWLVGGPTRPGDPHDAAAVSAPGVYMPVSAHMGDTFRTADEYPVAYATRRIAQLNVTAAVTAGTFHNSIEITQSPPQTDDPQLSRGVFTLTYAPGYGLVKIHQYYDTDLALGATTGWNRARK